ncbi:putative cytokinetic ring protein SteA [Corynebacterium sputi]|uniref:putative cytokinetic ring protein SteA n=1 Tax=Corynebacterium sputi TaxID=489915 RepID=UPI00047B0932|nr:putative cytokinetic ring protein SteA [Corynebacterium sputi]
MSLFSRKVPDEPGVSGTVRRRLRKLSEGNILVIDAPDISLRLARQISDAKPAAVVNVSAFTTGRVPNYGPQLLAEQGIVLLEGIGEDAVSQVRDGKSGRVYEDDLYVGKQLVGSGRQVTVGYAESEFVHAQADLAERMGDLADNFAAHASAEAPLLLDGLGVPDVEEGIRGRKVVIVGPGEGAAKTLHDLRNFIAEFSPVLIGVDSGADTVRKAKHTPTIVIATPTLVEEETLLCGAKLIVPAATDGTAEGLERLEQLDVQGVTFPALTESATDLAFILAGHLEAEMVVNVGDPVDLETLLDDASDPALPSAVLARLKVGGRLVDGSVVASLYRIDRSGFGVAWAILVALVAIAAIVVVVGSTGDGSFAENLATSWSSFTDWISGLWS